jgi:hypothetical protein
MSSKRTRRLVSTAAALAVLAVTAAGTSAQEGVATTRHNFSADTRDGSFNALGLVDYGEICVYCHTPTGDRSLLPCGTGSSPQRASRCTTTRPAAPAT